jgi:hypothetical protein
MRAAEVMPPEELDAGHVEARHHIVEAARRFRKPRDPQLPFQPRAHCTPAKHNRRVVAIQIAKYCQTIPAVHAMNGSNEQQSALVSLWYLPSCLVRGEEAALALESFAIRAGVV